MAMTTLTPAQKLASVRRDATALLDHHGLLAKGWTFVWDNAKRRGGQCNYSRKTISMSKILTPMWSEEEIRETLLHEIAHALVGPGFGHGTVWKAKAHAIGSNGSRTHSNEVAPKTITGVCPNGHTFSRMRMPAKNRSHSCPKCGGPRFNRDYIITWTRN